MLARLLSILVRIYQKSLSALSVGACRYYPSCSEYALWLLRFENPWLALCKITLRILRCNQLFSGGIAYPSVHLRLSPIHSAHKNIKYWLIPATNEKFLGIMRTSKIYTTRVYIIKSLSQR